MINRLPLVSIFLCLATTAMASATEQSLRPGGIAIVEVGSVNNAAPEVTLNDKPLLVMQRDDQWVAVPRLS